MECFRGQSQVAASTCAVEELLAVARGRRVIIASPGEAAERRERPLADLPLGAAAEGERLLEAELRMRCVPGVERLGSDVDEQACGGRPKLATLVACERLADVAHRMTASAGVQLDARKVDKSLGHDRVVTCAAAELGRFFEQCDSADQITRVRGVTPPLACHSSLEHHVAAALGEAKRSLPVRVRGRITCIRQRGGEVRHRARRPLRACERPYVQCGENVCRGSRAIAGKLIRESAREQRTAALLGCSIWREPVESAVICGDRIREATVPEGGRAGCEVIRTIRLQSGDCWW